MDPSKGHVSKAGVLAMKKISGVKLVLFHLAVGLLILEVEVQKHSCCASTRMITCSVRRRSWALRLKENHGNVFKSMPEIPGSR